MSAEDIVSVKTALLCDDIRREDSGKLFVIGVYSRDVRFRETPAAGVFSFLVVTESPSAGEFALEFRAKLDDAVIYQSQGKMTSRGPSRGLIPLRNVVIETNKSGTLTLEANRGQRGWEFVTEISIIVPVESSETPTTPAQPAPNDHASN